MGERLSAATVLLRRHALGTAIARDTAPGNRQGLWHLPCQSSAQQGADREEIMAKKDKERGAIGYILLWLLGVPAGLLFVVFLLRGCT